MTDLATPTDTLFRQLLDAAPDAMVGADPSGRIVFANAQAERLFGYPRQELLGQPIEVLVPDDLTDAHRQLRQRYAADPVHRAMGAGEPLRARRRDGTVFPVEISLSGLHTETGLIMSAAVRDITDRLRSDAEKARLREVAERAKLQEQLQRTQRVESLGELAGGVAHDFNNLLAVIINYATFIADTADEQAAAAGGDPAWGEVHADVQRILHAARRGGELTRQLLAFARKEVTRPQVIQLGPVVQSVEDMLRRSLGEHISLEVRCHSGSGPVLADPGQLEQVLVNLAVNARDAMPRGGTLTIETDSLIVDTDWADQRPGVKPGEYVRLRVSDTGAGMPREVIDRVFEPFFTTKEPGKGTGLGLAMVYGIVTGSGGTVGIYSEPGMGTTINILLPVTDRQPTPAAATPPVPDDLAGHGETVLLVEDEPALRQVCARMLTSNGYTVLAPDDTAAAVHLAHDHPGPIDLLLTDVVMPHMLGTTLAEQITTIRGGVPVLYMSGYATPVLTTQGALDPQTTLLEKPFSRTDLLIAVQRSLADG